MQLGFFSTEQPSSVTEPVSWSHSRIGTLKSCSRKYYYQYFGSKKRTAKKDPQKKTISFLSKLSNRHLIPGTIVHDVLAIYFRKSKAGEKWDINKLKWLATKMLDESIQYSQEVRNSRKLSTKEYPPDIFKELYYESMPENELREKMEKKIMENIQKFYSSPKFQHLKIGGQQDDSVIENNAAFPLLKGIEVSGKIDIAYSKGEDYIIADWKTGKHEFEDNSLQLLAYALWAIDKKIAADKNIRIQKAYLLEDELEEFEYSEQHLLRAKMRIMQDSESLAALDNYGKQGIMEAFKKCNQKKICDLCSFQEVCDMT